MQRQIVLGSAILCAFGTPPGAAEVCVACEAPQAEYRCNVEQREKLEKYGIADEVVPQACVLALARIGGHGTCRITQPADGGCIGTVKTLGLGDVQKAGAEGSGETVVPSLGERAGSA